MTRCYGRLHLHLLVKVMPAGLFLVSNFSIINFSSGDDCTKRAFRQAAEAMATSIPRTRQAPLTYDIPPTRDQFDVTESGESSRDHSSNPSNPVLVSGERFIVAQSQEVVRSGVVPDGYHSTNATDLHDPFRTGVGFLAARSRGAPSLAIARNIPVGTTLPHEPFGFHRFQIPPLSEQQRLADLPQLRSNPASRATHLGLGSTASAYLIHNSIPGFDSRYQRLISEAQARNDRDALARLEREWREQHSIEVVKLIRPDAFQDRDHATVPVATDIDSQRRGFESVRRFFTQWSLARYLFDGSQFRGRREPGPYIRGARILSDAAEHSQGRIRMEVVRGPTALELQHAVDRLNPATSRYIEVLRSPMSEQEARRILEQAGLTWQEAQQHIQAAEDLYRRAQMDAIHNLTARGMRPVYNRLPSGLDAPVGFDWNLGQNIKWDARTRSWVYFDI